MSVEHIHHHHAETLASFADISLPILSELGTLVIDSNIISSMKAMFNLKSWVQILGGIKRVTVIFPKLDWFHQNP